jgi:murein endopeptidase
VPLATHIALGLVAVAGGLQVHWQHSVAVGDPAGGRLVHGVRLPAEGRTFVTWDPVLRRSPNRPWRRWGTDRLVRVVLRVAADFHAAHPRAARMAVGDLSRPHGGDFGPQFGYIGHASHQNGLDVDVYYPRADGRELAPRDASEIDRVLSQELVDRFVRAGAEVIFVGPNTGLHGPPGVVQPLVQHDNHLHVRLPAGG